MAGDTAGTDEDCRALECEKVRRLRQGWVVGYSGHLAFIDFIMDELSSVLGRARPGPHLADLSNHITPDEDEHNPGEDVVVLMSHKTHGSYRGELTRAGQLMCWRLNDGYHAIGSGTKVALGAMAHGATAREAVEAAIIHDNGTGGHVTEVEI